MAGLLGAGTPFTLPAGWAVGAPVDGGGWLSSDPDGDPTTLTAARADGRRVRQGRAAGGQAGNSRAKIGSRNPNASGAFLGLSWSLCEVWRLDATPDSRSAFQVDENLYAITAGRGMEEREGTGTEGGRAHTQRGLGRAGPRAEQDPEACPGQTAVAGFKP